MPRTLKAQYDANTLKASWDAINSKAQVFDCPTTYTVTFSGIRKCSDNSLWAAWNDSFVLIKGSCLYYEYIVGNDAVILSRGEGLAIAVGVNDVLFCSAKTTGTVNNEFGIGDCNGNSQCYGALEDIRTIKGYDGSATIVGND